MSGQKAQKVQADVVRRMKNIRDLWLAVHNDPEHTVQENATEFFWLVQEILEGRYIEQLEYRGISKARVLAQAKEG